MKPLRVGDRVRILHCPVGWLPVWLLGTEATVERVNGAGVTLRTDVTKTCWETRYLPRREIVCLERLGRS